MKSENNLEVLLYRHPLKTEREEYNLECKTIKEIYEELKLELPIENYFFLDGDIAVSNYDEIPQNDKLYIKVIPSGPGGGGDFEEEGKTAMWAGGGMTLGGAGLIVIGALTSWAGGGFLIGAGISLAISGLTTFGAGYYLYTYDIEDPNYDSTSSAKSRQAPSIKGGNNQVRKGQKVPILLGRHLVFPWYAAKPYTTNYPIAQIEKAPNGWVYTEPLNNTDAQYLNLLLGNTYEPVLPLESTIQIGEVPISEYDSVNIVFQEDNTVPYWYPQRVIEDSLEQELVPNASPASIEHEIVFSSAKDTKIIDITIVFPRGLYYGPGGTTAVWLLAEWKNTGDSDATYQPFIENTYGPSIDSRTIRTTNTDIRETCRFHIIKTFDNNTPASPEYNPDRQYTFRISRVYGVVGGSSQESTYIENVKSFTGTFDDVNDPVTWPILPAVKEKLNTVSMWIKATDQLNSAIDNLNYEMINYQPVYTGNPLLSETGPAYWSYAVTRNPASAFLYVLTNEYVNKDPILTADLTNRINYESLETWYTFCEDLGLECNNYLVNDITVEELLKNIASTGFASWNVVDNKYTIYVDTYNSTVTQLFTPRNSWEYQGAKSFNEAPTALEIPFINSYIDGTIDQDKFSEGGFGEETRYVYADGRSGNTEPLDTDIVEKAQVFGAMPPDQVWRLGRYMLACTQLRPEVHTFTADIEHIMCTRWDRIKLQHDVPLIGLFTGRIISVTESGGNTLGFVSDEIIQYEVGKSYAVQLRATDGTITNYPVNNLGTDSTTVTLTTPLVGTGLFEQDNLFAFGEEGLETLDLIVIKIEAMDDLSAKLTCLEYNEAIYDAYQIGSGSIPAYTSRISSGGSSGAITVNTLPESQAQANSNISTLNSTASALDYRASIVAPVGSVINSDVSFYPDVYTDTIENTTTLVYTAYWNGNKIYTSLMETGQVQTKICDSPARHPKLYSDGSKLLYINNTDNHLYLKDDLVTVEDGTAIYTANNVVGYAINHNSLNIFVWTYDTVYELDYTDSYSVLNTYSVIVKDMLIAADSTVYYVKNDGFIYTNNLTFSSESLFYNEVPVMQIQEYSNYIYFIRSDSGLVYYKAMDDVDTGTSNDSDIATSVTWGFAINSFGEIVYSNTLNGRLYVASTTNAIINATLSGEPFTLAFTGDLTSGSNIITDVNNDYIDQLAVGDTLSSAGLVYGTVIRSLGNTTIELNVTATDTITNAEIVAGGDRILLDANKVIIDGTIEANKLSSSAIDSKARASNGEKITEIDLDLGTMVYRNSAGDPILTFDPNDVGNELTIDGTITASEYALLAANAEDIDDATISTVKIKTGEVSLQSSNFSTGVTGWKIDTDTDSAEFNNITARGTVQASGYDSGDGWKLSSNGDIDVVSSSTSVLSFDASTGSLAIAGDVQSTSYTPGSSGFFLDASTGSAEFNDVKTRGVLSGTFSGVNSLSSTTTYPAGASTATVITTLLANTIYYRKFGDYIGTFFVNGEVYSLADIVGTDYVYLYGGSSSDIFLANFSSTTAYPITIVTTNVYTSIPKFGMEVRLDTNGDHQTFLTDLLKFYSGSVASPVVGSGYALMTTTNPNGNMHVPVFGYSFNGGSTSSSFTILYPTVTLGVNRAIVYTVASTDTPSANPTITLLGYNYTISDMFIFT